MSTHLQSFLPWSAEIDGDDLVVRAIRATCFGGKYDTGDDGHTESGVLNDGSDPNLFGVALPIRSTEESTRHSPLAFRGPHIPWKTVVMVWREAEGEKGAVACELIDNGPDVLRYPTHALDLNPNVALAFNPDFDPCAIANEWMSQPGEFSYRVVGGAKYIS
jgi:hypothetical protein